MQSNEFFNLKKAVPFLLHPNSAILVNAAHFFAALSKSINTAEKLVQLVPKVFPFLKRKNHAAVESVSALLTFLKPPLSRAVYDLLVNSGFVSEFIELLAAEPGANLSQLVNSLESDPKIMEGIKESQSKYNSSSRDELEKVKGKLTKIVIRLDNSTQFSESDRAALLLMKDFIVRQTQHRLALEAVSETDDGIDRILLNQVERERGRKGIRNVAALKIEKSKNENEKARNVWKTPYFTNNAHIVKDEAGKVTEMKPVFQLRYSQSKIALRELIYKKRHACRIKMVEDLMDVSIDWDTSGANSEIWMPRGRLVAHVHEHTGRL